MANIKQQKKRIGTAQRQRMENLRYRSTIKTLFNRLQLAVDTGEKEIATSTHQELVKLLDRSITRGTLHRNTAARKKARAARMLLQEPKTDATTIRKAKKKVTPRKKAAPKAKKVEETKAKKVEEPKVEEAPVEETTAAADEAPSEVAADEPTAPEAEAAVDAPAEEPEAAAADDDAEAADEAKD